MIKPNENKTLTDEAYSKIKQMMFQRKILPSQKLIYKDLVDQLNMSQTPIISALSRLEEQGFLVSTAFRGFHVKPITIEETIEFFGIREALEAYVVEQVILKAASKDLNCLKEKATLHAEYKPDHYDNKRLILDADLHIQMALICGNNELTKVLARTFEHIILRYPPEVRNSERMNNAVKEHNRLMKLIAAKNIPEAVGFVRQHVKNGRDFLVSSLKSEKDQNDTVEFFDLKIPNFSM